ncbi:hypothetical protein HK096_008011 [Nowakowskiella sp. JEL0078]|nr:hypothetical protein HK096_008011 [Nowakowskiella sp. JEL0078]
MSGLPRGIVDTYGILLFANFLGRFLTKNESIGAESYYEDSEDVCWDPNYFKLSRQVRFLEHGKFPMPIYTAVRHERPWSRKYDTNLTDEPEEISNNEFEKLQSTYEKYLEIPESGRKSFSKEDLGWLQWWEFQPYQIGCDEVNCYIPSWSFGRKFKGGRSVNEVPEQSFALLLGITGSVMCAPWTATLETIERGRNPDSKASSLAKKILHISENVASVHHWVSTHPVHAAYNWNPLYKLDVGPQPPGLNHSKRIQLIDAGCDNNQAIYVLARPCRNVDVTLILDASGDVEQSYVSPDLARFCLRKDPNYNPPHNTTSATSDDPTPNQANSTSSKIFPLHRYCQTYHATPISTTPRRGIHNEPQATTPMDILYLPLLSNPGFPEYTPVSVGFGKIKYEAEEVANLAKSAGMNFELVVETVRKVVKQAWERKRDVRLSSKLKK